MSARLTSESVPCKVTTKPVGDAILAECRCGWRRRVERRSAWPDGLPLRSPAECQELAEHAARAHVSRPGKAEQELPTYAPRPKRRRAPKPVPSEPPRASDAEIEATRRAWMAGARPGSVRAPADSALRG